MECFCVNCKQVVVENDHDPDHVMVDLLEQWTKRERDVRLWSDDRVRIQAFNEIANAFVNAISPRFFPVDQDPLPVVMGKLFDRTDVLMEENRKLRERIEELEETVFTLRPSGDLRTRVGK